MNQILYIITICIIFVVTAHDKGQKERVPLHAESSKLNQPHSEHLDHEAVLGSQKLAQEFDELSPEESKRRLRVLAKRMDVDEDGFVTEFELNHWVYTSLISLDKEETKERFSEIDADGDGFITWTEYLSQAFGVDDSVRDSDDDKLMAEDKRYFTSADYNHDDKLTEEEFTAFQNPEHHQQMHQTLIENTMVEKDTDKNGKIDLEEYLGESYDESTTWYTVEKQRFTEYDQNKNGYLEGDELTAWMIPDLRETAKEETAHLFTYANKNQDGKLSIEEIVNAYKVFAGSEATNFGETLLDISHDEL